MADNHSNPMLLHKTKEVPPIQTSDFNPKPTTIQSSSPFDRVNSITYSRISELDPLDHVSHISPTRRTKNLKNLQLNLQKHPIQGKQENSIPISSPEPKIDSEVISNHSLSTSSSLQSAESRSSTPTNTTNTNNTNNNNNNNSSQTINNQMFRRIPALTSPTTPQVNTSFHTQLGNSGNYTPPSKFQSGKRRSNTSLSLSIPTNGIGGDSHLNTAPLTSVGSKAPSPFGDYIVEPHGTNTNFYSNGNMSQLDKKQSFIPFLPLEKPSRLVDPDKPVHSSDHKNSYHMNSSSISSMASSPPMSSSPLSISGTNGLDFKMHTKSYSSEIKPQTILHSFSEPASQDLENFKYAYPNGPICVLKPNLFLYSEPTIDEVTDFDVIINVAQEIKNYTSEVQKINNSVIHKNIEYYFIPWTHNSRLTSDFPKLTQLIDDALKNNKKVLIHCQCGVSRSASLIMAYFMKIHRSGYNDAYRRLKEIVPQISPNLSLIYELMEWGEKLETGKVNND